MVKRLRNCVECQGEQIEHIINNIPTGFRLFGHPVESVIPSLQINDIASAEVHEEEINLNALFFTVRTRFFIAKSHRIKH
jgi:hypothetical protein